MKPRVSLTSVLAAVLLFAVTVAMHEAARADGGQGRYHFRLTWNQTGSDDSGNSTRLRANFLSIPDSIHSGESRGPHSKQR